MLCEHFHYLSMFAPNLKSHNATSVPYGSCVSVCKRGVELKQKKALVSAGIKRSRNKADPIESANNCKELQQKDLLETVSTLNNCMQNKGN